MLPFSLPYLQSTAHSFTFRELSPHIHTYTVWGKKLVIERSVKKIISGKYAGLDEITVEILKRYKRDHNQMGQENGKCIKTWYIRKVKRELYERLVIPTVVYSSGT